MKKLQLLSCCLLIATLTQAQGKFYGGSGDGFAVAETSVILPVQLLSFTAAVYNGKAQLYWEAVAGQVSLFIVEVSSDGTVFNKLAEKEVVSSNVSAGYNYVDGPRTGTWYYRLRWKEPDGTTKYSKILAVAFPAQDAPQVYYDRSSGSLHIQGVQAGSVIVVYSSDGRLQKRTTCYTSRCNTAVPGLPAGVYYIRFYERPTGKNFMHRFVITH